MLRKHHDSLYSYDHPLKLGMADFGTRSTVVQLADGGLVIHSPGPWASTPVEQLRALGPVRALVAPNKFHHLFLAENCAQLAEASVFLAPGLARKRPRLPAGETLSETPPALWAGELEQIHVEGAPPLDEIVFFHPASRSLLLTDLCFNFGAVEGFMTKLTLRLTRAYDRFGPSRLAGFFMKDKAAVKASVDRILQWDFERVIVAHGDVLESGGRQALRQSFAQIG